MKPLQRPNDIHLQVAQGWLKLDDYVAADRELDEITSAFRSHPDVLEVRWHIYAHTNNWKACVDIADAIIHLDPHRADGWVHRSVALHALQRTQEALDQLLPVTTRFSRVWIVPYNLACYCAQLGRLIECQAWFKKAMAVDEHTVKRLAIDDPDLKPLWDSMSGTMWKRE